MRYNEKKGHWPMMKAKAASSDEKVNDSSSEERVVGITYPEKSASAKEVVTRLLGVGRST